MIAGVAIMTAHLPNFILITASEYARLGIVSTAISIAYTMLVIVPWYALLGLPLRNPAAPWPF